MKSLKALVITAPGINCDLELSQAFAAAGAEPESILLSRLIRNPTLVDQFALIGLPGGFSYGDDIAAGRIMAALMRREMYPAIAAAITRGTPMICPCNGFQIAVQAGLLPGPTTSKNLHSSTSSKSGAWPNLAAAPTVALSTNIGERFHDGWTCVEIPSNTKCVWTRGLSLQQDCDMLPSAHGEGRLMTDVKTLETLEKNGQIALRYAAKDNFNGSMNAVAGICDPSGLVFGLMPHPERFTRWTQHPWWTRLCAHTRSGDALGLSIFKQAVAFVGGGEQAQIQIANRESAHHNNTT
jgi:phosphoribosylformylglycinamidine synthase